MVTIQFVITMVESYILVAAAFVFLGFGGSHWSSSYVERYIALAVSIGVKIMLLYLLISTGMNVSQGWVTQAESVATSTQPATDAFSIMGSALIFAALCWHIPKLLAGILGGSPSLNGGDVVSTIGTMRGAAMVVGSGAMRVGGWAAGGAMSAAQAAGFGNDGSGSRKGLAAIGSSSSNMSSNNRQQPPPPSSGTSTNTNRGTAIPPPKA